MKPAEQSDNTVAALASVLALVWVAWLSDIALARAGGYRWGQWYGLLASAATMLAAAIAAWVVARSVPALRRRVFRHSVVMLLLAGSALLWLQRLAWRPSDHHRVSAWLWWGITVGLIAVPFLLARLRPRWVIAAAPLLVLAYHLLRPSPTAFRWPHIVGAVAAALAVLLIPPVSRGMTTLFVSASMLVAFTGSVLFGLWSGHSFIEETAEQQRSAPASEPKPNIVLIVIDTLRADRLGVYGYRTRETSPFLDRFAAGATLYRNAYATTTWTVPSVATMFTGLPPELHGVTSFGRMLPRRAILLAEELRESGYHTIGISTNPLIDRAGGFARGFDRFALLTRVLTATGNGGSMWSDALITMQRGSREGWLPPLFARWTVKPAAEDAVDAAIQRLDQAAPRSSPVFLFVHLLDPHHPPSVLADETTEDWRITQEDRRFDPEWSLGYDREIRYTDAQIQRLVAELDRRLDPRHTIIAVVADHGEQLGEDSKRGHGANLDDSVLRVPLIVRMPSRAASVVDDPFSLNHLPALLTGKSLPAGNPLIRAHLHPPADPASSMRGVQLHEWKFIEISRGGNRREQLLRLPDEHADRQAENPAMAAQLRARLNELPANPSRAPYDAEEAAKLRSLGYLH
jgi:arylsulfatase A-like enzyme